MHAEVAWSLWIPTCPVQGDSHSVLGPAFQNNSMEAAIYDLSTVIVASTRYTGAPTGLLSPEKEIVIVPRL